MVAGIMSIMAELEDISEYKMGKFYLVMLNGYSNTTYKSFRIKLWSFQEVYHYCGIYNPLNFGWKINEYELLIPKNIIHIDIRIESIIHYKKIATTNDLDYICAYYDTIFETEYEYDSKEVNSLNEVIEKYKLYSNNYFKKETAEFLQGIIVGNSIFEYYPTLLKFMDFLIKDTNKIERYYITYLHNISDSNIQRIITDCIIHKYTIYNETSNIDITKEQLIDIYNNFMGELKRL